MAPTGLLRGLFGLEHEVCERPAVALFEDETYSERSDTLRAQSFRAAAPARLPDSPAVRASS